MANQWKTCILNQELSLDTIVSLNLSQVLNEVGYWLLGIAKPMLLLVLCYVIVFLFLIHNTSSYLSVCHLKSHIASESSIIYHFHLLSLHDF